MKRMRNGTWQLKEVWMHRLEMWEKNSIWLPTVKILIKRFDWKEFANKNERLVLECRKKLRRNHERKELLEWNWRNHIQDSSNASTNHFPVDCWLHKRGKDQVVQGRTPNFWHKLYDAWTPKVSCSQLFRSRKTIFDFENVTLKYKTLQDRKDQRQR